MLKHFRYITIRVHVFILGEFIRSCTKQYQYYLYGIVINMYVGTR